MKYIVLILVMFSIFLVPSYKLDAYEVVDEQFLYMYSESTDKSCILTDSLILNERNNKISLYNKVKSVYITEGTIITSFYKEGKVYLLSSYNNVYKVSIYKIDTKDFIYVEYSDCILNDINIYNNKLICVGSYNEDGLILEFDNLLNETTRIINGGKGFEEFKQCVSLNNYLYVSLLKDGISLDSPFANVGIDTDKLSVLVKYDSYFDIIDCLYFNEHTSCEIIEDLFCSKDTLYVRLKALNDSLFFSITPSFEVIETFIINDDSISLVNYKENKYHLYIQKQNNSIYLYLQDNSKISEVYKFNAEGIITDYKIYNGYLLLLLKNNLNNTMIRMDEYDIVYNEPIIKTYYSYDIPLSSNTYAESFFEDLIVSVNSLNELTPILDGNGCGSYKINLELERTFEKPYKITNDLIIKNYTNFIDGGIYKTGKSLEFFGTGFLNNERIYYGKTLDKEGVYEIKILDNENNNNIYTITIKNDYYKQDSEKVLDTTITLKPYESGTINIKLEKELNITELIINDKSFYDFYVDGKNLYINVYGKNMESYDVLYLSSIIYEENGISYENKMNTNLIVKTSKAQPILEISKKVDKDSFTYSGTVIDLEQSFEYFKLIEYSNNKVVNKRIIYKTEDIVSNYNIDRIDIYFVYNTNNNIEEELLSSYTYQDQCVMTSLTLNTSSGKLTNFVITESIPQDYKNILSISVNNDSLLAYYSNYKEFNLLLYVIIISIAMIGLIVGYNILSKKIKKKKNKSFI